MDTKTKIRGETPLGNKSDSKNAQVIESTFNKLKEEYYIEDIVNGMADIADEWFGDSDYETYYTMYIIKGNKAARIRIETLPYPFECESNTEIKLKFIPLKEYYENTKNLSVRNSYKNGYQKTMGETPIRNDLSISKKERQKEIELETAGGIALLQESY